MKKIKLTKEKYALVDDADYEVLNKYNWMALYSRKSDTWYADRMSPKHNGKQDHVLMHRVIMKPGEKLYVDHVNHNGLDNRRCNLRVCTKSQNGANQKLSKANKSGYKGVSYHKLTGKWQAYISIHQRRIHLGIYGDIVEAAKVYNAAAQFLFGDFAHLNRIEFPN